MKIFKIFRIFRKNQDTVNVFMKRNARLRSSAEYLIN